jgi:phage baseplate assembly protein W
MPKSLERISVHSDVPFRMRISADGDIPPTDSLESLRQSVFNILNTRPGTRPLNPEFGCNFDVYLFEPFDNETASYIGDRAINSLERFEPRIQVLKATVIMDEENQEYQIQIFYRVRITNVQDSVRVSLQRI